MGSLELFHYFTNYYLDSFFQPLQSYTSFAPSTNACFIHLTSESLSCFSLYCCSFIAPHKFCSPILLLPSSLSMFPPNTKLALHNTAMIGVPLSCSSLYFHTMHLFQLLSLPKSNLYTHNNFSISSFNHPNFL